MSVKRLGQMLLEERRGLVQTHGDEEGGYHFRAYIRELRKQGVLNDNISLRGLMEGCMSSPSDPYGENWQQRFPRGMVKYHRGMLEAIDAIGASTFADIGGQLLVDRIRDNYELAMGEIKDLIAIRTNPAQNLGTHKDPWLSRVYEEPQIVEPGQPFSWAHFTEQWNTLPAPEKRTMGLALEMEMIYADKTRQAMNRANGVGEKMGLNWAKRAIANITGLTFTNNGITYSPQNFNYNGTSYALYGTTGLWVNTTSGLTVTSYNDITTIETLFGHMTDLATGDPIDVAINDRCVLCTWDKQWDLHGAFTATDILRGAFPTSGDNIQTHYPRPGGKELMYRIVPSKLLYNMLTTHNPTNGGTVSANQSASQAKQFLYWGSFKQAFAYREVYPIQIVQAPPQNPAEFYQDIAVQVKVSEYGVNYVETPQAAQWSYNTAT